MADEDNQELQVEEGEGGGKKKLLIIIVAVVVLLGGGAAAWFMLGSDDPAATEEVSLDEAPAPEPEGPSQGSASYVAMPRPFVFNVPGSTRDRLVQIKVQLLVRGSKNEETAKMHIPSIEGALLRVFSGANADDLATTAGKEAIKLKALKDVQAKMQEITGSNTVEKVLFTGFVMQ